jgi:hypothetical protein
MAERAPELIYFLHQWMTVEQVEEFCRSAYRVFDKLPPIVRFAINDGDAHIHPKQAAILVRKYGERRAAEIIMDEHSAEQSLAKRRMR